MNIVAFDTETHLIRPGRTIPRMVCVSIANSEDDARVIPACDPECKPTVDRLLRGALAGDHRIVGQNVAFDLAVLANTWPEYLPVVFELVEKDGAVLDTRLRQKLLDIAAGVKRRGYSLKDLAELYEYPFALDKDTWRLRYGELDGVPLERWPDGARDYSAHDAMSTHWVCTRQGDGPLVDEPNQVRAAWALHLVSAWGLRTDPVAIAKYRATVTSTLDRHRQTLEGLGWLRADGTRDTKKIREYALAKHPDIARTPTGAPQLTADAVSFLDDPLLTAYQEYSSAGTALAHVEELVPGTVLPIHTRFDSLLATGRTSSSGPNVQNRPTTPGDRECFVSRPGYVFCDVDYDGLELRTFAQACIDLVGFSRLADALNAGRDPHSEVGARLLGISIEEFLARKKDPKDTAVYYARQCGKVVNFGAPGGMGAKRLVAQARAQYDVIITEEGARKLIAAWREAWPEVTKYFEHINSLPRVWGGYAVGEVIREMRQLRSGRVRGRLGYCEACNSYFQGLGADAAKSGLYAVVRACYTGSLRDCRVVSFIHDELLVEAPETYGHERAMEIRRLFVAGAQPWVPDVKITASPVLTRRWSKNATVVHDDNGRLKPWEQET